MLLGKLHNMDGRIHHIADLYMLTDSGLPWRKNADNCLK